MHNATESGKKGRAKNQGSHKGDSESVEGREDLDVNQVGRIVRENDGARNWAPDGTSKLGGIGGRATRVQPKPMSPGGSANQREAEPGGK